MMLFELQGQEAFIQFYRNLVVKKEDIGRTQASFVEYQQFTFPVQAEGIFGLKIKDFSPIGVEVIEQCFLADTLPDDHAFALVGSQVQNQLAGADVRHAGEWVMLLPGFDQIPYLHFFPARPDGIIIILVESHRFPQRFLLPFHRFHKKQPVLVQFLLKPLVGRDLGPQVQRTRRQHGKSGAYHYLLHDHKR